MFHRHKSLIFISTQTCMQELHYVIIRYHHDIVVMPGSRTNRFAGRIMPKTVAAIRRYQQPLLIINNHGIRKHCTPDYSRALLKAQGHVLSAMLLYSCSKKQRAHRSSRRPNFSSSAWSKPPVLLLLVFSVAAPVLFSCSRYCYRQLQSTDIQESTIRVEIIIG